MALERGFGGDTNVTGPSRSNGPWTFFLKTTPPDNQTTAVLLDDSPALVIRHRLYVANDKTAAGMTVTCAGMNPHQNPDPCPRECYVCNAAIKYKQIGRKLGVFLTLIDEKQGTSQRGKNFFATRKLLELDSKGGSIFEAQKKAYGGLVGMKFQVFRSGAQNSSRIGDSWSPMGKIPNLLHYFWQSPAIPQIIEASNQPGKKPLTHEEAVRQLVTPIDYEKELGTYDARAAEQFVGYMASVAGDGPRSTPVNGFAGQYQAPPLPGQAPAPAQGYMPPGSVPSTPYAPPVQGYAAPPPPPPPPNPGQPPAPTYAAAPQASAGYGQPAPAPAPTTPPWEGAQTIPGAPGYAQHAPPQGFAQPSGPPGLGSTQQGPPPGWAQYQPQGAPQLPDPRGATPMGQPFQAPPMPTAYQPFPQGAAPPGYGAAPAPMQPFGAPPAGPSSVPNMPPAQASQGWASMPPGMAPQAPPPQPQHPGAFGGPPPMQPAMAGAGMGPPIGQTTGPPPF